MEFGVSTLRNLALTAVCRDIVRHGIQWKSQKDEDPSAYWGFRRMFADDALKLIGLERVFPAAIFWEYCEEYKHTSFLDLILNPFTKEINLPPGRCPPDVLSKIVQNCKDLRIFVCWGAFMPRHRYVPFFRNINLLTELHLESCEFLGTEIMEVIASSLVRLKILNLCGSKINDDHILALCGHRDDGQDFIPSCVFAKRCKASNSLSLQTLFLYDTAVNKVGIACVLTHIPTIKRISPNRCERFSVANILCDINRRRRRRRILPSLSFRLKSISYQSSPDFNLKSVLLPCPELEILDLDLSEVNPEYNRLLDETLLEANLGHLENISLHCESMERIATECFLRFWKRIGSQITALHLGATPYRAVLYNSRIFRKIVSFCPNIGVLCVNGILPPKSMEKEADVKDFLYLGNVEVLSIQFDGEPHLVEAEVLRIMASCKKVKDITLRIPVEGRDPSSFVDKEQFPDLEVFNIWWKDSRGADTYNRLKSRYQ